VSTFHWKDGWFFSRRESDGAVIVDHRTPANFEGTLDTQFVIPENEWASIVASVSAYGENAASWQFARLFHSGDLDRISDITDKLKK
jgi:hypothetical protein